MSLDIGKRCPAVLILHVHVCATLDTVRRGTDSLKCLLLCPLIISTQILVRTKLLIRTNDEGI